MSKWPRRDRQTLQSCRRSGSPTEWLNRRGKRKAAARSAASGCGYRMSEMIRTCAPHQTRRQQCELVAARIHQIAEDPARSSQLLRARERVIEGRARRRSREDEVRCAVDDAKKRETSARTRSVRATRNGTSGEGARLEIQCGAATRGAPRVLAGRATSACGGRPGCRVQADVQRLAPARAAKRFEHERMATRKATGAGQRGGARSGGDAHGAHNALSRETDPLVAIAGVGWSRATQGDVANPSMPTRIVGTGSRGRRLATVAAANSANMRMPSPRQRRANAKS